MAKKKSLLFPLIVLALIAGTVIFFGYLLRLQILIWLGIGTVVVAIIFFFSTTEAPDGVKL